MFRWLDNEIWFQWFGWIFIATIGITGLILMWMNYTKPCQICGKSTAVKRGKAGWFCYHCWEDNWSQLQ